MGVPGLVHACSRRMHEDKHLVSLVRLEDASGIDWSDLQIALLRGGRGSTVL